MFKLIYNEDKIQFISKHLHTYKEFVLVAGACTEKKERKNLKIQKVRTIQTVLGS